jgi:hypothetical protein
LDRDEFSHRRWGRWGWGCTCKVSAMHLARHFQTNSGMRYKEVFLENLLLTTNVPHNGCLGSNY